MTTRRHGVLSLSLLFAVACQGAARSGPARPQPAAADPAAAGAPAVLYGAPGTATDPALAAEVDALLRYQRPPLPTLDCPGLWIAGSCGDGQCDGALETPESCPADCVFHLAGAYNDLPICPAFMEVKEPQNAAEAQAAVQQAVSEGKRIRVLGASHSASQLICGDGLALRMTHFADLNATQLRGQVAYVQPGVLMVELGDWLYQRGLSIGYTHIGFRRITVAGALGTAAHGSAPLHEAALSQRLESVTMVLADGSVRTFERQSTPERIWRALDSNLGLLGVITEVGVRVEPAFNLDTRVDVLDEQVLLNAGSPLELLVGCDFGEMNWFPGQRQVMRICGVQTNAPAQQADNTLLDPGVSADLAPLAKLGFHAGTCSNDLNASLEEVRFGGLKDQPPLTVTDARGDTTHVSRAVGPAHRMLSAELVKLDGNKYFQMDWEVAVPEPHMQDALRIARQVFDAHDVHLPGVGAFLRFAKIQPGGYLAYHTAGGEFAEGQSAMFFETPTAVPVGYSDAQLREYLYVYQELAALFIRRFGARAHWGKNLDALFDLQRSIGTYAGRIEPMNDVVAELDPYGVFSNAFAERIGIRWPRRAEDFAAALGASPCRCGTAAEPVCDVKTRRTFANGCRAACAHVDAAQLIAGPCAALEWGDCSPFESATCVWRKQGGAADRGAEPLLRY